MTERGTLSDAGEGERVVPIHGESDSAVREPVAADRDKAIAALAQGREMEHAEDGESSGVAAMPEVPGLGMLSAIVRAQFFTEFFCFHASLQNAHPTLVERVAQHRQDCPKFYAWCRASDFIARGVVLAIVILLVTAVAFGFVYKTFYAEIIP